MLNWTNPFAAVSPSGRICAQVKLDHLRDRGVKTKKHMNEPATKHVCHTANILPTKRLSLGNNRSLYPRAQGGSGSENMTLSVLKGGIKRGHTAQTNIPKLQMNQVIIS